MKKTLVATLISSVILLAGCQDKDTEAKIKQLNQTVAQLSTENTKLKEQIEKTVPAIFVENDEIFNQSEIIKHPKSKEDYQPEETKIEYSISTIKTNIDWLNDLLWKKLTENEEMKNISREQFVARYQTAFEEDKKEVKETPSLGISHSMWTDFIAQKEKLATFAISFYDYEGGAHGIEGNRYFTIDLTTRHILTLNDLFNEKDLPKVKTLLWEQYNNSNKEYEPVIGSDSFNLSNNIYLDSRGVHFIYDVYEIAPYAAGEQDLLLYFGQLEELFKPEFKRSNYVKFL
ncbi:RsiV family protein [Haemophilus haemolyticus]|uniref:RsiV family protein n=1 Tax=Haemophilus haemolyticus TaxID=726 RepID=UPI000E0D768D|nr:RsiV family protein [Haemophilus haemolyticus]